MKYNVLALIGVEAFSTSFIESPFAPDEADRCRSVILQVVTPPEIGLFSWQRLCTVGTRSALLSRSACRWRERTVLYVESLGSTWGLTVSSNNDPERDP